MDFPFIFLVVGLGSLGAVVGFYIGGKIGMAQHSKEHAKRMQQIRKAV